MIIRREDFKEINDLTRGSNKKVWFTCDWCGIGILQPYKTYLKTKTDLCRKCRNKETANKPEVKRKQSKASKKAWNDPEYRKTVSKKVSQKKKEWWSKKSEKERIPTNKRSYDKLKKEVNDHGLILDISKEEWEKSNYTTIYVRCPIHPIERFKFRKGSNCPYCSKTKIYMPDIYEECYKIDYKLISVDGKHIEFYCNEGHYNKISSSNWREGTRCIYCCSGWKIHKDDIIKEVEEYGFEILDDLSENINTKTILTFKCKQCGHIIKNQNLINLRRKLNKCQNCYKQKLANRLPEKERYYYMVKQYTLKSINNYNNLFNKEGISIDWDNTIDHIYSVKQGFEGLILPHIIGSPVNLQILSRSENCKKNSKSWITNQELYEKYEKFIKENKDFVKLH